MKRVVTFLAVVATMGCSFGADHGADDGRPGYPPTLSCRPLPRDDDAVVEVSQPPSDGTDPAYDGEFGLAWTEANDVQVAAGPDAFLIVWTEPAAAIRGRFFSVAERVPIGPSFTISDRAPTTVSAVAAGADGNFLVVWRSEHSIRATRVTLAGGPSASTEAGTGWGNPNVGWIGDAWLVTWEGLVYIEDSGVSIVRGIRLGADAAPLDVEPFQFCGYDDDEAAVLPAEDGVVLVCTSEDDFDTWANLRDAGGNVTSSVRLDHGGLAESAAFNGHQALMTFTDYGRTEAVLVDFETGLAGSPAVIGGEVPQGFSRQHSAVAWNGARWLVVREEPGELEPNVFLDDVRVFTSAWSPRLAESDGTVIVVAIRDRKIIARAFGNGGPIPADEKPPAVLSPPRDMLEPNLELGAEQIAGGAPNGYVEEAAIAAMDGTALIAWSAHSYDFSEVRFRLVTETGATPEVVLDATDEAHFLRGPPVATSNGTEFLVGWFSLEDNNQYLKVTRISAEGVVLDPGGVRVGPDSHDEAVLVWHRDHWIAAWIGWESILARRLRPDGTFIDPLPIALGDAGYASSVQAVSNGRTTLVTWFGEENPGVLFGEGAGFRNIPAFPSSFAAPPRVIAAGTDGENYLIAYVCYAGCRDSDPRSAILQPRLWSIAIDGVSGSPREPAPQPVSDLHPGDWYSDSGSIAHGSDWWVVRMETPDPYADSLVSDVYLGDERIFEKAHSPLIARDGSFVVVAALHDDDVVYRVGRTQDCSTAAE